MFESNCEFNKFCNCGKNYGTKTCDNCKFYEMIDSGYGYCIALPIPPVVAHCKITCTFFKEKISEVKHE